MQIRRDLPPDRLGRRLFDPERHCEQYQAQDVALGGEDAARRDAEDGPAFGAAVAPDRDRDPLAGALTDLWNNDGALSDAVAVQIQSVPENPVFLVAYACTNVAIGAEMWPCLTHARRTTPPTLDVL